MNLITLISEEILSDTDCAEQQSQYLEDLYLESENKTEIDKCFICLCGFSLSSLIEMAY